MNENIEAQTTPETQPEENGAQSERTFTQEEVNKIVQDRLAKERSRSERSQQEQDTQAIKELTERENKLACREYILDKNYPKELLDCIDTSDPNEFKTKAETLYGAMLKAITPREPAPLRMESRHAPNSMGDAFSRDVRHKPKNPY